MELHKKWVQEVFDRASPAYGEDENRFFGHFGKRLVDFAKIDSGTRILDVATGKGAVLIPAAQIVGSSGKIVGVDLSQGMLNELANRVSLPWVELQQMDAEALDFPDQSFDVLFCSFAIFFFSNIGKALSEFKRVLKPGGKLAMSIWGKRSPLNLWVIQRAKELGAIRTLRTHTLETGEALHQILQSDFPSVRVVEEKLDFAYKTRESWWNSLWAHGSRGMLEQLSEENLAQLKAESFARVLDEPIEMSIQTFFAIAENP